MTKLTGSLGVRNEINVDIIGTGARGKEGMSAYAAAQLGGYSDTEAKFYVDLAAIDGLSDELEALL